MPIDRETAPRPLGRKTLTVLAWAAFAVAVAINLYGLYVPSQPGPPMFPGFDKVAHVGSFALVMLTGLLAGLRARPLGLVLVIHAVLSEILQGTLLPDRSGDVVDVVADLAGIALGWLLWRVSQRLLSRRPTQA